MNAAERIYVASTSDGDTPSRLAEELARRIEDDIASGDFAAGVALGALRELSGRYSAGRSVVREALGLLERRGLGRMRPGPCGGFIFSKPKPEIIGAQLADYFRASGVTLRQVMDAREAVDLMAARLAGSRVRSDAELAPLQTADSTDTLAGLLSARLHIARLAGEPVLLPFVECLNALTADFGGAEGSKPAALSHAEAALGCALRTGDAEATVVAATRAHSELAAWLTESEPRAPSPSREMAQKCAAPAPLDQRRGRTPAPAAGSLSSTIARQLAADIAQRSSAGARLGSEWDLCERFNVSRLTLRQAIRLLQDTGLVECRRGRGNGLMVRDRRAAGSIRLLLAFLIGEKVDPMAAGTILFQLNCFIPALAVARANTSGREQLEAALSRVESCDPFDRYDLLGLVHCVSRLADSPIIDLFSRCLAAYEARFRPSLAGLLPGRSQAHYFQLVRRLLDRLPTGDSRNIESAKAESYTLMLEMSQHRPI
jgi:DNA-binding FadR family transcriptional regulator